MRKGLTAPIGDDAIPKAAPLLPFGGSAVGAAIVPIPQLTLHEYASLRAELSVSPERTDAILREYRVMNPAVRGALEEHWRAELAASPEMRATFEQAFARYAEWLRSQKA